MAHRDAKIAHVCAQALQAVLEADAEGVATREAVQLIADLVKRRKCVCPPAVVDILLSLKLSEAAAPGPKGVLSLGFRIYGFKKGLGSRVKPHHVAFTKELGFRVKSHHAAYRVWNPWAGLCYRLLDLVTTLRGLINSAMALFPYKLAHALPACWIPSSLQ